LTDVSGEFFTVVSEAEYASLAGWEEVMQPDFERSGFDEWFSRMQELAVSGRRGFYTIQHSWA
jgi:hypothetical protein